MGLRVGGLEFVRRGLFTDADKGGTGGGVSWLRFKDNELREKFLEPMFLNDMDRLRGTGGGCETSDARDDEAMVIDRNGGVGLTDCVLVDVLLLSEMISSPLSSLSSLLPDS